MDKRTVTAVLLSLIVLIGWSIIQKQLNPPRDLTPDEIPGHQIVPTPQVPDRQQQQQKEPLVAPVVAEPSVITGDIGSSVVVETDLYKAVFSTQGGIISYWELKE
jgi:YidC/Oxa1 family membrane protein insertase